MADDFFIEPCKLRTPNGAEAAADRLAEMIAPWLESERHDFNRVVNMSEKQD